MTSDRLSFAPVEINIGGVLFKFLINHDYGCSDLFDSQFFHSMFWFWFDFFFYNRTKTIGKLPLFYMYMQEKKYKVISDINLEVQCYMKYMFME